MKLADIVYPITKPNVELAISVYHRKIFFSNIDRIPQNKPVLFISNHPTAFLEPVIYAGLLNKPIHSLVRGDFFQNKIAKIGLESLYMIAIFRMRDGGVEGLRKNAATFQYCYDIMAKHKQVLIMAEGFTKQQKRLAPLQKGAARMALGAAHGRRLEDLHIIPIGANFTEANQFRGEIMIEIGQPLKIGSYLKSYSTDKKLAIDQLTADMGDALRGAIIHIEEEADDELFEKMVCIARRKLSHSLWPSWNRSDARFILEKNVANHINMSSDEDKEKLLDLIIDYPSQVVLRSRRKIVNWLIIILGFPFWIIGRIYRDIPFGIGRSIVTSKVAIREFESPVRFGMGALFIILWTIGVAILVTSLLGWKAIWIPFALLFVVWFSVIYEDVWTILQHDSSWNKYTEEEKNKFLNIESVIHSMI